MNGTLPLEVARHSERILDLEDDVKSAKKHVAELETAIEGMGRKLDKLLVQKRLVIALVLLVGGGLLTGIPWLMKAQLRSLLLEMQVVEMKAIK